ncbi:hypothetical protein ACWDRM_28360 [Streptomyces cellulosae]
MDKKISAAIWSGEPNGRGGFSTYTNLPEDREVPDDHRHAGREE